MRRYNSDKQSYQAIAEAMQQIRYNTSGAGQQYMYEQAEEGMSPDEEEAVAQLMDEALYEMDMEDDEDNLNEAPNSSRKARRRRRLRNALLIGAGLAAAAAPLAFSKGAADKFAQAPDGEGIFGRSVRGAQNFGTRYAHGLGNMSTAAGDAYSAGMETLGKYNPFKKSGS